MKKYFILSLVAVMSLVSVAPAALAREEENRGRGMSEVKKELREEVREEKQEQKDRLKEFAKTLKLAPRSLTLSGTLVSVGAPTSSPSTTEITVNLTKVLPGTPKKWPTSTVPYPVKGNNIVVKIDEKTTLLRAYGGKMKLSDMAVGDELHIVVKFNADGSLNVRLVQDRSLHIILRKSGAVESIDAASLTFVLKQEKRTLTVKTNDKTKFFLRGSVSPSFATLKVGDKVKVEGIINLNNKTVNASSVTITKRQATSTPPADTTAPTGTISINAGATTTVSSSVSLSLSATDNASGVTQMRFSNDGVTFSVPVAYATSASWTLSAGTGVKTVYVQYMDGASNWSSVSITDTIELLLAV